MSDILQRLAATIAARAGADPATSHTAAMLAKGPAKCAGKFGEEAIEAIVESVRGDREALTRAIADAVGIPVIASGGVGTLDHLVEGVTQGHASAVLAASIFHFGEHTVREAKQHMARHGVAVRL